MLLATLFWAFVGAAFLGTLGVLFMRKTVYNVLSLVVVFLATAGLFVLARAPFLGMVLVILYVGAVVVFFLFAVMFFGNQLESGPASPSLGRLLPGLLVWGALAGLVAATLGYAILFASSVHQGFVQSFTSSAADVGKVLYTQHADALQVVGLILLAAIIGGTVLTSKIRVSKTHKKQRGALLVSADQRITHVRAVPGKGG